jgi:hypothetical protein
MLGPKTPEQSQPGSFNVGGNEDVGLVVVILLILLLLGRI